MTQPIEQRLAQLPAKVSAPFRQLLSTGQISEDVVNIVLDAGDIVRDPAKLIGFTAGYLYLRSQAVPVHDVITMAKQQQSRLNLAWTATRWKDEHERLSRAEALRRLAGENIHYDVSAYQRQLPPTFPGYLIRSSRRLGMEGLRQRRCVASYHDRIQKGVCAIAAIFIEKQRWTVQLELKDSILHITQIKSRYNALPPAAIRRQIHEALDIPLPDPTSVAEFTGSAASLYMENLRRVLPLLRANNIQHVTVSFDGEGDSGSIHDIAYTPAANAAAVSNLTLQHLSTHRFQEEGEWRLGVRDEDTTLNEVIDALTYDYLEEANVDWYNGDGGFGELVIDVGSGIVSLEINQRFTESNCEYSAERDIATGDHI